MSQIELLKTIIFWLLPYLELDSYQQHSSAGCCSSSLSFFLSTSHENSTNRMHMSTQDMSRRLRHTTNYASNNKAKNRPLLTKVVFCYLCHSGLNPESRFYLIYISSPPC